LQGKGRLRFSFKKADKILKRSEFIQLSRCGNKTQNRHFIVRYLPGQFQRTRLGITVTKNVGCAAIRNRIKRFAREYFRLNRHRHTGNWDISVIVKREAAKLTSKEAFFSLKNLFNDIALDRDSQ
jgi:ribonuclease P protein component